MRVRPFGTAVVACGVVHGIGLLISIVGCGLAAAEEAEGAKDAKQVLSSFEEQFAVARRARFSGSTKWLRRAEDGQEKEVQSADFRVTYDRDKGRLRVGEDLAYQRAAGQKGPEKLRMERIRREDKDLDTQREGESLVVGSMLKPSEERVSRLASVTYGSVLLGKFPGLGDIPTVLRAMKVETHSDTIDGVPVTVLSGTSAQGKLEVWLDPKCNFAARRVSFKRDRAALYLGDVVEAVYSADGLEKRGEGCYIPASYRIETVIAGGAPRPQKLPPGVKPSEVTKPVPDKRLIEAVTIADFQVNPELTEADFSSTETIPNGIKVYMGDAPHLNYVWKDGKAVPGLESKALAAARAARFEGASGSSRRWLVVFSLTLLLAVFIAAFVRRQAAKRGSYGI